MTERWFFACIAAIATCLLLGTIQRFSTADGYSFDTNTAVPREALIATETYQTLEELHRAAADRKIRPEDLGGFAHYNDRTKLCTIHVLDPAVAHEPQLIGHEVIHCLYGDWHPVD